MILSFARRCALVAVVTGVAACTEPSAPTAPSITSFQPILEPILNPQPNVGGLYQGTMLFTGATGGSGALRDAGEIECAGNAFNEAAFINGNDTNDASMAITQDKTITTNVTVRLTSEETGLSCKFTGVIGSSNGLISDALPADCSGTSLLVRCKPDPTGFVPIRELRLVGSSLSATFDGWPASVTGISGRTAQTFNVFRLDNELQGGNSIGGLVVSHTFFMNRR